MKRLIVMIYAMMFLLTACTAPVVERAQDTGVSVAPEMAVVPTEMVVEEPTAAPVLPTQQAAPLIPNTGEQEVETAPETSQTPNAVVDVDGLNFRIGPGLNHRILGVLPLGVQVHPQGRSVDGEWIAVKMADGREGWLFGAYLKSDVDFASLPVMEAYGGPLPSQPQPTAEVNLPGRYTLYMTIADNRATVSLSAFPADSEVSLRLAVRGGGQAMTVANGRTDANGSAAISFDMPRYWADGSRISQTELTLIATSADGSVSRSASIVYYQGE